MGTADYKDGDEWVAAEYARLRDRAEAAEARAERLQGELEVFREYYEAHQAVEHGVINFDLHEQAVIRLRGAQDAVRASLDQAT